MDPVATADGGELKVVVPNRGSVLTLLDEQRSDAGEPPALCSGFAVGANSAHRNYRGGRVPRAGTPFTVASPGIRRFIDLPRAAWMTRVGSARSR